VTHGVLCGSPGSGGAQEEEGARLSAPGQDVAATIDGEPITWDEVNSTLSVQLYQLESKARELRMSRLREMVERRVLEREAERRGVTLDELLRREVESQIEEVTEEDAGALLAEEQLESTEENLKMARNHLRNLQRQRTYRAFLDSLDVQSRVVINPLPVLRPPLVEVSASGEQARGPDGAPITIIEFSDFTCGYCKRSFAVLKRVVETYGEKVRLLYRHFPLGGRTRGRRAAEASECAGAQGKFWEYHDLLFLESSRMDDSALRAYAGKIGLDEEVFSTCLDSGEFSEKVQSDKEEGVRVGVNATPTFFVNGRYVRGAQPFDVFKQLIDEELRQLGLL